MTAKYSTFSRICIWNLAAHQDNEIKIIMTSVAYYRQKNCASLIRILPYTTLYKWSIMKIGVTVHREGKWYVAAEPITGVTSQGKTCNEALKNFEEAFELWFECAEEWEKDL